ncbi:hypothetical protein [Halomicrococcus sp. NG-SE-24]|uniref:hypothetical protein n=1 Tax=Halomicrococcus sp. NG-SE-24 TaxID=3436928 RepID=UPI003D970F05
MKSPDINCISTARRTLLKGLAALGLTTGLASSSARNIIVFHSATEAEINYQFTVSGGLRKTTSSGGAPIDDSAITKDPEDDRDGSTVHGATAGGYDAYVYTGQITALDIDNCDQAKVWINGQAVNPCQLIGENPGGSSGSDTLPSVIELHGKPSAPVKFLIRVSGRIYSTSRHSPNSDYHQVEWQLGGEELPSDTYQFSGHIEQLQTSDGDVDIVIRQRD